MDYYGKRNVWIGAIVVGLILMVLGGCYQADQWRKAEQAEEKVAELTAACQVANDKYQEHWAQANQAWDTKVDQFLADRDFQLGYLLSPKSKSREIDAVCTEPLDELTRRLKENDDPAGVYDRADLLIGQLAEIANSPLTELDNAVSAKELLESVDSRAYYVGPMVYDPPVDAVDPGRAKLEYDAGVGHLNQGWVYMANSYWDLARKKALTASDYFGVALEHASSPTPTPEPTNTPWPTNTPEPYDPPSQSSYDWSSSDDSSGSDSSSWDSGSDSGSWDSGGSDSGSWDSGSDSGSWDSGGSDSGSWDSGGSDSGSWKAPRMAPTPQRVIK